MNTGAQTDLSECQYLSESNSKNNLKIVIRLWSIYKSQFFKFFNPFLFSTSRDMKINNASHEISSFCYLLQF